MLDRFMMTHIRVLAALTVIAFILAMVGCAAGDIGAADDPDETIYTDDPNTTDNSETAPPEAPAADGEGMLLVDVKGREYDPDEEELFTLPEYPGVQFLRKWATISVQQGDDWRYVMQGSRIYLADLNGDGAREFCTTRNVGSGIIDQRIYVYDFADDMRYTVHQRTEYDYDLSLVDGRMVALRYAYGGLLRGWEPLCEGALVIEDRQIFFVSGDLRVQGIVESPRFDPELLQDMRDFIQDFIDREMWFSVFSRSANDYYFDIYEDVIRPSIVEEEEGRFWLDLGDIQGDGEAVRYMAFLELLTGNYIGYSYLEEYVYHDPADPSRLIVCTEVRDTGYRDLQTYCEDLIAGNCQAHPDTYIVRLDCNAVYRWGEDINLYEAG